MSGPEALAGLNLIDEPPLQELLGLAVGGFFLSDLAVLTDAIDALIHYGSSRNATSAKEGCAQT
jgi:hypothetical protein